MKLGFLYAGQGSQKVGMGADLYEAYPAFRQGVDQAELEFDWKTLCFTGPEAQLNQTRYTQPCMVGFAVGMTEVLKEKGIVPSVAAGLSLGEYSALYAAGVLEGKTAIELAAFRGAVMEEAGAGVESAMVAVLGLDREKLQQACEEASAHGVVVIANYNCPGQLVIGGEKRAVEEAVRLSKELGAKRCMPLKVSGPFHTPLMKKAGEALEERFSHITFHPMTIPVVFNCLGDVCDQEAQIPKLLVRQVQSSVYMEDSLRKMGEMGLDALIEIGPGKAISGFARKTVPEVPIFGVETVEDVEKLTGSLEQLEKERSK